MTDDFPIRNLDQAKVATQRGSVDRTPRRVASAPHLTKADADWDWSDLRDFVVRMIEQRWGSCPRNPLAESGIFKAHIKRWGPMRAAAIARAAFKVYDGAWHGAPVQVQHFSKGSDPFFSRPIAERLSLVVD